MRSLKMVTPKEKIKNKRKRKNAVIQNKLFGFVFYILELLLVN